MHLKIRSTASFLCDQIKNECLRPLKRRRWRNSTAPFEHKAARGLVFELTPGQFIDYIIYTEGAYEKRFLHLVEALLPQRRIALDIGANIGNHALFFSRIFSSVHAFEPNPGVALRLRRNIAANKADNISVHEFGLSETCAELPFLCNANGNAGMGKFLEADAEGAATLTVRRGDEVVQANGLDAVDFIKIDVEGHEVAALKGLRNTIDKQRPVVAFEFHAADYPDGYFDAFRAALPGYRFYECLYNTSGGLARQAAWQLKSGGFPRLREITVIDKETYKNIIAAPNGFDDRRLEPFLE